MPKKAPKRDKPAPLVGSQLAEKPTKTITERLDAVIACGDAHAAELAAIIKETIGK